MFEKPSKIAPPRTLKGRRARKIWRELAPIATENGTLNAGSTHLLTVLCVRLAQIAEEPDKVFDGDLQQARSLSKSFGVLR